MYEHQFEKVHQLLKEYGCKPTFNFEPEYQEPPILPGLFFYKPQELMHTDQAREEWRETVDAKLDVCVPTRKGYSENNLIRFDIEWSQKVQLYSMYISLPTFSRSKSLSLGIYKNQDAVMAEIGKWLKEAGCKKFTKMDIQKPMTCEMEQMEQMSLF